LLPIIAYCSLFSFLLRVRLLGQEVHVRVHGQQGQRGGVDAHQQRLQVLPAGNSKCTAGSKSDVLKYDPVTNVL
jgi:hypothetical protein